MTQGISLRCSLDPVSCTAPSDPPLVRGVNCILSLSGTVYFVNSCLLYFAPDGLLSDTLSIQSLHLHICECM